MIAIPLIGTAFTGAFSAWIAFKMAQIKGGMETMANKVDTVAGDVLRVEKATNSHTDLLIAATKIASHAEGMNQERVEQVAREAQQAKGAAGQVQRQADLDAPGRLP